MLASVAAILRATWPDFPTPELIAHPKAIVLPHLGASTGEAEELAAQEIVRLIRAYLERGARVCNGMGMTETGPLSTQTSIDDPPELRVTTVGRAMPHTEIKIVDEEGRLVPRGESGELCTRGYCVMRGYWGDPERTAEEIGPAHWIKTGDIAEMNDAGYLAIVGRLKDMIIRGGENIYPREIEEFLYTNPKIDEVEVFGVPDPKYGEQVAAWIRLKHGEHATEA